MSQTLPLLDQPVSQTTGPSLIERITAHRPRITSKHVPATADRWVLASNLQKAIRRGLVPNAEATAIRLLAVDPQYFWRRVVVVAYEDVGFGDIELCHELLRTFRREALHRELGAENVAQYFAHELALARKSRAMCDALAALEFSVRRGEYERQCQDRTDDQLLATICNSGTPVTDRIAALRHVCGYRVVERGMYRSGVPARTDLMHEVCRRLELPEIEARLFTSGQGASDSLNIPLPMVFQMARASQQSEYQAEQVFEGKHGILYAALDRHTRAGRRCFARLAKEVRPVREFFATHPELDPVAVIGAGVFVVEGATLDRRLVFDGADTLRREFNQNFLEYVKVAPDDHDELLSLVKINLRRLNRIRAGEMA
ncbi:MAG: hypothetical protein Q8S20_09735 [Sulfuritalea sp.]|nr:hypothetical protein [Sulfuritalea sp.]